MKHLFLLNGPPRCGKDTVAEMISGLLLMDKIHTYHMKLASPVKRIAAAVAQELVPNVLDWSDLDAHKDEPWDSLLGRTPRELAIAVSEALCKPLFGQGFFGTLALREVLSMREHADVFTVSDCGFQAEVNEFLEHLSPEDWKVHLWQIYRQGTSFEGDSRGWLSMGQHATATQRSLLNVGTRDDLKIEVINALREDLA